MSDKKHTFLIIIVWIWMSASVFRLLLWQLYEEDGDGGWGGDLYKLMMTWGMVMDVWICLRHILVILPDLKT
jgi:hypothetical protein